MRTEMSNWKQGIPPDSKTVLAVTVSDVVGSLKKRRTIVRAEYLHHKEVEVDGWDYSEGVDWYCEEEDCYYIKEGWYELIHYWDDYSYITIPDPVIAWMPMPELPESEETTK